MKLLNLIKFASTAVVALALAGSTLQSCNIIYDDQADCPDPETPVDPWEDPGTLGENRYVRMYFSYDYNMKWADAFPSEVTSVAVYAYDTNGKLVAGPLTDSGAKLAEDGYYMDIFLSPGTYTFVCVGGLEGNDMFKVEEYSTTADFLAGVPDVLSGESTTISERIPGVYHGRVLNYTIGDDYKLYEIPMELMKDTNALRIMLQDVSGETMDADDYEVYIECGESDSYGNGVINVDNSLNENYSNLTYVPWAKYVGEYTVETKAEVTSSMVISEFTSLRLMKDVPMSLKINNAETGELILGVPLIDLALILKGLERADLDDQEYLDRQDDYNFTFFLGDGQKWMSAYIYVNGWKVVLSDVDF